MRVLACVLGLPIAAAQDMVDAYGFESAAVVPGTVCDDSYDSLHALLQNADEPVISETGEFATFYADTLCADGTEAMHVCSGSGAEKTGGASIGVVDNDSQMIGPPRGTEPGIDYSALDAAEGTKFYQIMAKGVDGFTYVCFDEVTLDTPGTSVTASIQYYVAQNGWHEEPDRLRVWAETSTSSGGAATTSLLPMDNGVCVEEVHYCTAAVLNFLSTAAPARARSRVEPARAAFRPQSITYVNAQFQGLSSPDVPRSSTAVEITEMSTDDRF